MSTQSTEYGYRKGNKSNSPLPMAASTVLKKQGGGFVKTDSSGNGVIATAADSGLVGHLDFTEDFTTSATAGATILPLNSSLDCQFELPLGSESTWNDNKIGLACDLIVESNIQKVDLTRTAKQVVIVREKGFTNPAGTVLSCVVGINPAKLVQRSS